MSSQVEKSILLSSESQLRSDVEGKTLDHYVVVSCLEIPSPSIPQGICLVFYVKPFPFKLCAAIEVLEHNPYLVQKYTNTDKVTSWLV